MLVLSRVLVTHCGIMNNCRNWGTPWSYLQPTTEINGSFVGFHRKMDRRWWRAQVRLSDLREVVDDVCYQGSSGINLFVIINTGKVAYM